MTDSSQRILTERRGHVLVITINRPEARNAFDAISAQGMQAAMDLLDGEELPSKAIGQLEPGQRLRIETPGGGGHGTPGRPSHG